MGLIANVHTALSYVKAVAEQMPNTNLWKAFVDFIVAKITQPLPSWVPHNQLAASG